MADLLEQLAAEGYEIAPVSTLTPDDRELLRQYFTEEVFPDPHAAGRRSCAAVPLHQQISASTSPW
jgi:hypothetical protein